MGMAASGTLWLFPHIGLCRMLSLSVIAVLQGWTLCLNVPSMQVRFRQVGLCIATILGLGMQRCTLSNCWRKS